MSASAKRKEDRIELRVSRSAKALLQRAAAVRHKSVTEFVLDSGLSAAAEALADRRQFELTDKQWRVFHAALDAPVRRKKRLEKLLTTRSIVE
jgi:uncharacterized protein (DUF1778 family)